MSFNINSVASQSGRIAIVTGANVGLGFETTRALAKTGMKVIMACRNLEKAKRAREKITHELPEANIDIIQLDLGKLSSVHEFVDGFKSNYDQLDLLINNAGIMIPPFSKTEDGFESQMGVNYFAHFLLTNLLFPVIDKTKNSRIVSLSSIAHKRGVIDFENLHAERGYSKMHAYQQSKLACLMFAIELQRRIEQAGSKVVSVAAHPGVSNTNLGRHIPKWILYFVMPFFSFMIHKPEKAAQPTLMAALDGNVKGGDYFGPNGKREMKGEPSKVNPEPHAFDKEVAEKLWAVSEELTNSKFSLKE